MSDSQYPAEQPGANGSRREAANLRSFREPLAPGYSDVERMLRYSSDDALQSLRVATIMSISRLEVRSGRRKSMMSSSADTCEARRRIEAAYDPELLRAAGRRLIDMLADHLAKVQASEGVVLPWREPAENVQEAAKASRCSPSDRTRAATRWPITLPGCCKRCSAADTTCTIRATSATGCGVGAAGRAVRRRRVGHESGHGHLRHGPLGNGRGKGHGRAAGRTDRLAARRILGNRDPRRVAGEPDGPADRPQRDVGR